MSVHHATVPIRILVVDDSQTIRLSAETLLGGEGYAVYSVEDGFAALSAVVERGPDLIFIDIMMPRLDGYQTCALIKSSERYRKTPVVLLSSKDSIFDKAKGRLVGADDYLTKPFSREDLFATVARFFPAQAEPAQQD